MFSKNIEALKDKNPVLTKQLQELALEDAKEKVEKVIETK